MAKIYAYGELLVEIMRPVENIPLNETNFFKGPYASGAPGIFISTAARLGHQCKMWAGVGKDKFGDMIVERLEKDGVDSKHIARSDKSTAVAFVAYDDKGEREFIFHIGNTAADDVTFDMDTEIPDCFHVMGCSLMASQSFQEGITEAVSFYAAKGSKVSFDPNLRPELLQGRSFRDVAGKIMDECSIFLPGVAELMLGAYDKPCGMFGDMEDKDEIENAVRVLFNRYPKMEVINVKLGSDGCVIYKRNGETVLIPVYDISQKEAVLDVTGAGDSFDAAFVGAYLDGKTLEEAGKLAAKAGALNVVAFGPMEGDMTRISEDIL